MTKQEGYHSKKRGFDEISEEPNFIAQKKGQVEEEKLEESKFQQIKEILQCIICVEELKETKATIDCGHAFCLECI